MPESEELKALLRKNIEVSEESLKILKKMNRARVVGGVFKFVKWLVVIGISLGLYYYIEPYMIGLVDTLQSVTESLSAIRKTGEAISPSNISPDLLEKLQLLFKK